MDTPTLRRLQEYLKNTSFEQQMKDWAAVKALGLTGSPTAQEFIASFRHTPAYRRATFINISNNSVAQPEFEHKVGTAQFALAA